MHLIFFSYLCKNFVEAFMKCFLRYIVICLVFLWVETPVFSQQKPIDNKPFTLVIDAGHGGKDAGAVGKIAYEKNLNLDVALLAGKLIHEQFPEVRIVYTRKEDVYLTLQRRVDIVNQNSADLFISIHTNSAPTAAAKGVETFILGTDKMEQNLDVAMRENAVIKLESDYQTTYQGFEPNSIDSYIMFELMQNAYMEQSLDFATLVQRQFVETLQRDERGVRQAAFWVLLKSACPSILLEMGFISNPSEEKYLASSQGKRDMAQSLCQAFSTFYRRQQPKIAYSVPEEPSAEEIIARPQERSKEKQARFAIQICATKEKLKNNDPKLKGYKAQYFRQNGYYKYYCYPSNERESVQKHLSEIQKQFPDAWIVTLPEE